MTVKKKILIALVALFILLFLAANLYYRYGYLLFVRKVDIKLIAKYDDLPVMVEGTIWRQIRSQEHSGGNIMTRDGFKSVKEILDEYNIDISQIDFQKYTLIVSFGGELEKLEYDSTIKIYAYYIGFSTFKNIKDGTICIYQAEKILIFDETGTQ